MLIQPTKRTHYSTMDFETTTNPEKLGVRIWTMTFRPSLKLLNEGKVDKALDGWFKENTLVDAILNRRIAFKFNGKEQTIDIYGHTVEGWLEVVEALSSTHSAYNIVKHQIYYHNLKRFDGFFIIPTLNKYGYQLIEDWQPTWLFKNSFFVERFNKKVNIEAQYIRGNKQPWYVKKQLAKLKKLVAEVNDLPEDCEAIGLSDYLSDSSVYYLQNLWNELDEKEYSLLKKDSNIYSIALKDVEFRDSLLLFPASSLKGLGETLTKQYKDSEEVKKDPNYFNKIDGYDYKASWFYPTINHLEKHKGGKSLSYARQDTFVLWAYLTEAFRHFKNFGAEPKLTIGSTAYNHWLQLVSKSIMEKSGWELTKNERNADIWVKENEQSLSTKQACRKVKNEFFPWNAAKNDNWMARGLYKGGNTGGNFNHLGKIFTDVTHVDATSMYPSVSNSDRLFPYGEELETKPDGPAVYVARVTAKLEMNSGNNMPIANINNKSFSGTQHQVNIKRGQSWYLCEPEIEMFKKTYGDYWHVDNITWFAAKTGKEIFGEFIDLWFSAKTEAKRNGDEGQKNISKFPLNALTGKLGSKVEVVNTTEDGHKYKTLLQAFYTPLVSFITAYARCNLAEGCLGNFDKVLYWDTDSLFFSEFPEDFPHPIGSGEQLGEWEKEHEHLNFAWMKAKGYMFIEQSGKQTVRIAGFNFDQLTQQTMTFNKFFSGFTHSQLQGVRYEEGVVLEIKTKEQKAVCDIAIDTTQHQLPNWKKLKGEWKNYHFRARM